MKILAQILLSNLSHLCLQVENNSDLVFNVLPVGWWMIWYFSFKHNRHFLVDGLNSLPRSMELYFMVKFLFWSTSFQSCGFSLSCFRNCWDLIKHTFLWPYLAPRNMIIGSLCHYLHIDGFVCASTCPLPLGANTWLEAFVILIGKVVSRNRILGNRILCLLIQNL